MINLKRFFSMGSLLVLIAVTGAARAQETYTPITAENAAQITQIERIGNGVPRSMAFSPDGSRLAAATTLIITGETSNVDRMLEALRELDHAPAD